MLGYQWCFLDFSHSRLCKQSMLFTAEFVGESHDDHVRWFGPSIVDDSREQNTRLWIWNFLLAACRTMVFLLSIQIVVNGLDLCSRLMAIYGEWGIRRPRIKVRQSLACWQAATCFWRPNCEIPDQSMNLFRTGFNLIGLHSLKTFQQPENYPEVPNKLNEHTVSKYPKCACSGDVLSVLRVNLRGKLFSTTDIL